MKKPTPVKPMGVSINDTLWKRVARWLLAVTLVAVTSLLIAILLLEWAAGCKESFVDSKGVTHLNECLFVNRGESK